MRNGKRCSYGRSVQIAVPFSNKTIYMRDNFQHQIRKMGLSISCWAIYLTNIDEFIMVTIPVAIMKCHPKIGPWLKWRAEISTSIIVKFHSLGDPSFFCRLILLSTLLCLPLLPRSLWHLNEFRTSPFSKPLSLIGPLTGLDKDRTLWLRLIIGQTCIISTN